MALGPRPRGLSPQSPAAPEKGGRGRRPSSALAGRGPAHLVRRLPGAKSPRAALTGALIPPPAPRPSSRQREAPRLSRGSPGGGRGPCCVRWGPPQCGGGTQSPRQSRDSSSRPPAAERRLGFATCSPRCIQRSVYRAPGPRRAVSSPPCYGAGTAARGAGGLVNRSQTPRPPHLPPHAPQPRACSRSQSLSTVSRKTPALQIGAWAPAPQGTSPQASTSTGVRSRVSWGKLVTSRASRPAAATMTALGLRSRGAATARTPRGPRRMTTPRRGSPAPSAAARVQRPQTSGQHSATAASSAG